MPEWLSGSGIVLIAIALITGMIKFSRWTGRTDEKFKTVEGFMDEVRADIKKIFERLKPPVAAGQSPIELTEYGEELSKKLRARDWARLVVPTILKDVPGKEPFQIHEYCKGYVSKISVKTHPDIFKMAYENGISDENMREVLGLVLRDELLKDM